MRFLHQKLLPMLLLADDRPYITIEPTLGRPAIIAFTGTRNARDLVDDIRYTGKSWPPLDESFGMVHGGFAKRTVRLIREPTLAEFIDTFDDFVLTGHSLGAGVCVLLASKLVSENKRVHSVYTFGSPTIGDEKFCEVYKTQNLWDITTRYVTPKDPICNYIPVYNHIGSELLLPFESNSTWEHHDITTYKNILQNRSRWSLLRSSIFTESERSTNCS